MAIRQDRARGRPRDAAPVTDRMVQSPPRGDWLSWRRTLDGKGYSPLNEITRENVRTSSQTAACRATSRRTADVPGSVPDVPLTDSNDAIETVVLDRPYESLRPGLHV